MDTNVLFRRAQASVNQARDAKVIRESSHESEDHASPRIAHTLTACCRCRQRKTRCDPNLPRCLPCERSGALCEYFDTSKGKKISRTYVIKLQDKVRALEAELGQYTDEEGFPQKPEDIVRPGGLIRLGEDDETPRFLGPSSGIAMTRLVMEEAKKYTDSRTIRELVPEVRQRRPPMQSPESASGRKKSYPMISAVPAPTLPSRLVTDKLIEVFNQKAQYLSPTLHEPSFAKDLQDVYDGDMDPYKNFVLRMVLAISMQKLDTQYSGLADSYYLAAMAYMEDVIRPKDIKTLQCLVLVAQYSLLTPTRTAIYYVVGLATRLCQQLGLAEEKTITQGVPLGLINPIQLDMKRRLSWIILSMELGLAHSMGRPNAFATGEDHFDVGFFEAVDDEFITADGILPAPVSEKKTVAVHFLRMRLLQAEMRRVLYQKKRPEPKNEDHPWYAQMEKKLKDWLDSCPESPTWSKSWYMFKSRYNTMIVTLRRPSPQVPKPSPQSASMCYEASAQNVRSASKQVEAGMIDITWIFLLTVFQSINTILWAISYPEVRALHPKDELEENVDIALDVISSCRERWPGTAAASHLYSKLAKACLRSYDVQPKVEKKTSLAPPSLPATSPPSSLTDANSPSASEQSSVTNGSVAPSHVTFQTPPPPHFGYVFNQMPEQIPPYDYSMPPPQPSFRSNSIFQSGSSRQSDRRFSYFPPEFAQAHNLANSWNPMTDAQSHSQPQPTNPAIVDPSYMMHNSPFSFSSYAFGEQDYDVHMRQGSLSQQQQVELMQTLETDGLSEIDQFMNLASQYDNPVRVKFENVKFEDGVVR
ncbi:fungal-specific transcription factor domain-containing protein [Amylocarpus encephaloides]|uniref:Fungal-specific transcription factor domain-containing protein n=1 Tax=Amylocarpus encephaloides TaxID=45428 RepID=A0A9P7Y8T6_9HELO|nr:fungal-specific transcription factor domain-containing protein [Amylocarpus encephaloides]